MDVTEEKFEADAGLELNWEGFNYKKEEAKFYTFSHNGDLPDYFASAIERTRDQEANLNSKKQIEWIVRPLSQDGLDDLTKSIYRPKHCVGGDKSSKHCGEQGLWPVARDHFKQKCVVYVISASLCPCLRCAKSMIRLAELVGSPIIVKPRLDYELTAFNKKPNGPFYLLFLPTETEFFVLVHDPAQDPVGRSHDNKANLGVLTPITASCDGCNNAVDIDTVYGSEVAPKVWCATCGGERQVTKTGVGIPW